MHVRSRTTIDPRIPPMTERATSGFHRPDRRCLRQAQSAVSRWASRMKDELHPTKNHFWGGFSSILCIYIFVIGITFQLILLVGGLAITDLQDKPWSQVSSLLPPQFVAVFFAHRVQRSHCSSVLIGSCSLTLSRFPLIFFYARIIYEYALGETWAHKMDIGGPADSLPSHRDSVNELICFLVWPLPETAMGLLRDCLVGALPCTHYVIRLFPWCGVEVLPAQKLSNFDRQPG